MTSTTFVGSPLKRREDPRFITGCAGFLDDIRLPHMLHAHFVRSPYAHAKIKRIDGSEALRAGAKIFLTGEEVARLSKPLPILQGLLKGLRVPDHYALAIDKVRFVGEPVVALAAEDRYLVEDLAELITIDYEPIPAVVSCEQALDAGNPVLHEKLGSNLAFEWKVSGGDVGRAWREAEHVVEEKFTIQRQRGTPIETRGIVAAYDRFSESLTACATTQAAHQLRTRLSEVLMIPENRIRVTVPDVGGAFGEKYDVYAEDVSTCLLSMRTGRPVKWVADRKEDFLATVHSREQIHHAGIAVKRDGTILGLRDTIYSDQGAYFQFHAVNPPMLTAVVMPGPYRIANYEARLVCAFTNKAPLGAYRGFGRTQACFIIERLIDITAREIGLDPIEMRLRNLIRQEEMPYTIPTGMTYDSGDYPAAFKKALSLIKYDRTMADRARLATDGHATGLGLAAYVEVTGYAPTSYLAKMGKTHGGYECATVRIDPAGGVTVITGACPHGQGLETTLAQIAADELGIHPDMVKVVYGDTSAIAYGTGTFGSRCAVTAGSAVMLASRQVRQKIGRIAAHFLDARPEDVAISNGIASVDGIGGHGISLSEIAQRAYVGQNLPADTPPGLEATCIFDPPKSPYAYAVHAVRVRIDLETLQARIESYAIVHDCGKIINPTIVEGQVYGGTLQGIGQALFEELLYDNSGILLSSSFMDYPIPTALDVPNFLLEDMVSPSPYIPGGIKGMGEGGAVAPPAAIAGAIEDALSPLAIRVRELPLSPIRIRELVGKTKFQAGLGRTGASGRRDAERAREMGDS